jgi:hypothetical protein
MSLTLQPTRVATGADDEGMLVYSDGKLVAVLVHLSDENEVAPGEWYLEAGFGQGLDGPNHPAFRTLEAAQDWIADRLARRARMAATRP